MMIRDKSYIPVTSFYVEDTAILSQESIRYRYPTGSFEKFMLSNGTGVIVGVLSTASYREKRELIRKTWAFNRSNVFFLVSNNWSDIESEFSEKRDLFWIDQDENYRAVNFKVQAFISAVERHVPSFRHLLKTDDDSYVRLAHVEKLSATDHYNSDYWGKCIKDAKVHREESNKWSVTKEEFREDVYPAFAAGAGYSLSRRLVHCMAKVNEVTKILHVEDTNTAISARACRVECISDRRVHYNDEAQDQFFVIKHKVKTNERMTELHNLSCHQAEADVISCASGCWTSPFDAVFPKGGEAKLH
jgi:beta-1,3-N-acetylglucosaminyltransferase 5/beta-1,3-galactosyltransferase 1